MGKFNILWIDDQRNKCKREQANIENSIRLNGLEPNVQFVPKASKDALFQDGHTSNTMLRSRDYDLLLIDYKLMDDLLGDEIVSTLREKYKIYVDIILYSSAKNEMIEAVKRSFDSSTPYSYLDDVYIVPLGDDFQIKTKHIIDKIVGSWYNAHSIRGAVLSKTSKFENMVSTIIGDNYMSQVVQLRVLLDEKRQHVVDDVKGKWNDLLQADDPVQYILERPVDFNWNVKKDILTFLVENKLIDIDDERMGEINQLFKLRNKFAHNTIKIENGECCLYLLNGKREVYSEKEIREIRDKISRVEKCLENLMPEEKQRK